MRLRSCGRGVAAILAVASVLVLQSAPAAAAGSDQPAILSTYVVIASGSSSPDCDKGDIPLSGGYHAFRTTPALAHFEPTRADRGAWLSNTTEGEKDAICAHVGRPIPWTVRGKYSHVAGRLGVSCNTGESLLSGGYYLFSGEESMAASLPESPARWSIIPGPLEGDASAYVAALCAELPTGAQTYTISASTAGGDALAHCYPGDQVLNGGWSGAGVLGSHPVDGGWVGRFEGPGTASALCFHPGYAFGLSSTYVRQATTAGELNGTASCDAPDDVLTAGWDAGGRLDRVRTFMPEPGGDTGGPGWTIGVSPDAAAAGTVFVLCGRRAVPPPPVWTGFKLAGGAALIVVGLALGGLGAVRRIPLRPLPAGVAGGALAVTGVVVGLLPLTPGVQGPDDAQSRHPVRHVAAPAVSTSTPTAAPTSTPTATPTPTATATPSPTPTPTPRATAPPQPTRTPPPPSSAPPAVFAFMVRPTDYDQDCSPNQQVSAVTITLNNSSSSVAAHYRAVVVAGPNGPWANLDGGSASSTGRVMAGQTGTLTISPRTDAANPCYNTPQGATQAFSVRVDFGPDGSPDTGTVTITDRVTRKY